MAFIDMNFMPKKPTKSHSQAVMLQINDTPANKEQLTAYLAMKLNRRADSPWYQRLTTEWTQKPGTRKGNKNKPAAAQPLATFSGLADSIGWSLLNREGTFIELTNERKVDVLIAYWRTIRTLFRTCWDEPGYYRLCQGFGPLAMHRLLAQYISKKVDLETVTEEDFMEILGRLAALEGPRLFHYMEGPFKGISGKSAGTQNAVDAMRLGMEHRDVDVLYSTLGKVRQEPDWGGLEQIVEHETHSAD